MYAVIEAGGKQYRVQEGDVITVEKIKAEVGETVTFNTLLISAEGEVKVGAPYLNEVVTGTVVEHGKGEKVIIFNKGDAVTFTVDKNEGAIIPVEKVK